MFVLIQNDPQCPAGSCPELIAAAGFAVQTVAAFANEPFPELAEVTGIIVLGGDMGVHETERFPYLEGVRGFMRRALDAEIPLLGICLGGQLLAQVAGGSVASPSPHGEKGIQRVDLNDRGAADPLFAGLPGSFVTFQLHNDSFTPPGEALLLGSSPACPAQAFRLGRSAYGVQFHPEVDPEIVACWGNLPDPQLDLLTGFLAQKAVFDAASRTILANFVRLAAGLRRP
ncbi:GMP synthase [Geomonas limicola]|uniref:GMP synthase n=1 Tax=Geomonas limicola TaxID=2740186 RepID=A0A6V8N4K2_9BACT|nr:type 1 glutamine amidotransferase [Geomonas limicola]GFO66884.1 GMP synthase [Geomonas limicola]